MQSATQTKTKKITAFLIITILAGIIPTSFVRTANAQFAVIDTALIGTVTSAAASELAAKTAQTVAVNLVLNNPLDQAALAGVRASSSACEGIEQAEQTVNTTDALGDFSVIGGSPAQTVKLTAKLTALQAVLACRRATLTAIDALIPSSVAGAQSYAKKQAEISVEINSLKTRFESLKQQQTAEIKDVLKAVMVRIILTVSKNLTTQMVNKMVEKYKIQDYLAYGDALTTQVYSMKYINENFDGDARQQMMVRSLLQSEKFPEKIKTVQSFANSKAQEYLGSACGVGAGVSADDQNYFLKCLAAYGAPQNNPDYHVLNAVSQAQAATASAQATTAAEISQSDGFAPPRNCQGSLAMQNQIDAQYDQVFAEKDIAIATVNKLKFALSQNPPKTTQEAVNVAQAAADQAIANANALGEKSDSPIIDVCEAIDSPAKFVSDSISKFLQKNLVDDTDLKPDNLPFYATFLSDVASNFLTNILTGGKSTSQVLKEAGVGALNGTLIAVGSAGTNTGTGTGSTPNPVGDVTITAKSSTGVIGTTLVSGQSYSLLIDFTSLIGANADPNFKPARMTISGLAGGTNQVTLTAAERTSGKVELAGLDNITQGFTLTVQLYGPNTQDNPSGVPLGLNGGWRQAFTVSRVNGASVILLRGPEVSYR
jgi:hypothetical protein